MPYRMTVLIGLAVLVTGVCAAGAFAIVRDTRDGPVKEISHAQAAIPAMQAKALPTPAGPTVLTLTGVKKGNSGPTTTKLDYATVDELAHEQVTVYEPFLKHEVTFTAVRVDQFLRLAGFPASVSRLRLRAVDDYHVALGVSALSATAFLATRSGGKPVPIAKGGPIRLVFRGKGTLAANSENWIWSIDRVSAR
jgi:hypothetical protein